MIKNYDNDLGRLSGINGDTYSIHDTFNRKMNNKKKDEDNDLRKYKYYLENKNGKKMKLLGAIMYTGTIFYFVFTILKLFKFI